jgi:hypothetical protein
MFSKDTFVNPYLSYEKTRKTVIPDRKLSFVNPLWTRKVDINQIEVILRLYSDIKNIFEEK